MTFECARGYDVVFYFLVVNRSIYLYQMAFGISKKGQMTKAIMMIIKHAYLGDLGHRVDINEMAGG